jgi:hypothetical protein
LKIWIFIDVFNNQQHLKTVLVGTAVTLPTSVREVLGSNIGPRNWLSLQGFRGFSSVPASKCRNN